jgi:hypothetical protein
VKVLVPGKHFPSLLPSEQSQFFSGTAVEYQDRRRFPQHLKAWGNAHTGEGIRFICEADAIDDPDHKGFWTTLALWNRWRHETFKNDREAELVYLDPIPSATVGAAEAGGNGSANDLARQQLLDEKAPPEIKKFFYVHATGTHTYGGNGRLAGTVDACTWYACRKPGCPRGPTRPIKQISTATGQLFNHLEWCQPDACKKLRLKNVNCPYYVDENGNEVRVMGFEELLPHHVRFVLPVTKPSERL